MKLVPRHLAGQLVLLMLGGFVVGNLFGLLLLWPQSGALHPIAREHALSRTITAYRLAHRMPVEDTSWLTSFDSRVAKLWIDRTASVHAMDERETGLAGDLEQRLGASSVTVRMPCRADAESRALMAGVDTREGGIRCVEIDLALGAGRWLHTRQALPVQSSWQEGWQLMRLSMLAGILPLLIVMYVFARRIMQPTSQLTDAAERMSRGERIQKLHVHGPEEIREIALAFNDMHERITRFVDERTRMLAAISHDLRTPLTSLELQAAMLPDSEERTEMLRTLEEVRQMVNETLSFAHQNAASEQSADVDLCALVAEVVERQKELGRDVTLQAPAPVPYRCRPLALKRAIGNLVENALAHGTHADVRVQRDARGNAVIGVRDDGPGIPEQMLERVFEPFFQLDSSRNHEDRTGAGVGLGLAIARDCIRAHGGSIQLSNPPGGGLDAEVVLPAERG